MNLLDRLTEITKNLFNFNLEMKFLREEQAKDQQTARDLAKTVTELGRELQAVRERVAHLETLREADRAEARAERAEARTDLERFKLEVERAMLRAERQKQIDPRGSGRQVGPKGKEGTPKPIW